MADRRGCAAMEWRDNSWSYVYFIVGFDVQSHPSCDMERFKVCGLKEDVTCARGVFVFCSAP